MTELSPSLQAYQYAWDHCVPVNVSFEITLKCNLRCTHCYNFDRAQPMPKARAGETLTTSRILSIIDELAEAGALQIGFTGGEALLHPDLLQFVRRARANHCAVKIKSNGTLFTEARVRELVEAGATETDISLYGATAQTHDAFTTVPGSFERTVAGLKQARDLGLKPTISFILHAKNVGEISEMIASAQDWGVRYLFTTDLTARYDGTSSSRDHRVSPTQFSSLLTGPHGELFAHFNDSENVQCACARTNVGIGSNGELYPCIGAPIPCGNLKENSFSELWKNAEPLQKIRKLKLEDFSSCAPCTHRKYCTRSSGSVYVDTGNYTGPEPMECAHAELRHRHHPVR